MIQPAYPKDGFLYRFGSRTYDLSARTHVMGVLNVTPDSFSDGGKYARVEHAVERALQMVEEGADFIDVGGESTRPKGYAYGEGAEPVTEQEELARVLPVIKRIVRLTDVPVSIDTYKSRVASEALKAGAVIVNDISGFQLDPSMASVIGQARASAVVMHIRGTPKTTQLNPVYDDLLGEVRDFLQARIRAGGDAGIDQILIDPGIGFGKTQQDNLRLIACLSAFTALGAPLLVGPSRKSFIGNILNLPVGDRLEGTLASVVACVLNGAHVVRIHDVREVKRAVLVADAIRRAGIPVVAQQSAD